MRLVTYRQDGTPVPTPVWFAQVEDRLYVMTQADTGKVRRIRHNAQVEVGPCTAQGELTGETEEGMARILDGESGRVARQALNRKYGLLKRIFDVMLLLRRAKIVHLEITPMA
jgi:hypothetical protein